jgi:hypothetical protein
MELARKGPKLDAFAVLLREYLAAVEMTVCSGRELVSSAGAVVMNSNGEEQRGILGLSGRLGLFVIASGGLAFAAQSFACVLCLDRIDDGFSRKQRRLCVPSYFPVLGSVTSSKINSLPATHFLLSALKIMPSRATDHRCADE